MAYHERSSRTDRAPDEAERQMGENPKEEHQPIQKPGRAKSYMYAYGNRLVFGLLE